MTKNAKIDNGEETASSIMMLGKLENYMQKKKKKLNWTTFSHHVQK